MASRAYDVAALVFSAHGTALGCVVDGLGLHADGLEQAARLAFRARRISRGMKKKLFKLEAAFQLARHITSISIKDLMADLEAEVYGPKVTCCQACQPRMRLAVSTHGQEERV